MNRSVPWLKSHSTPATLKWLDLNYQAADGICIPRNSLYQEYLEFSRRNQMQPVNAASFGKIIRKKFPSLTTRRLGTRGQSKYHYYGLTVRVQSTAYPRTDFHQQQTAEYENILNTYESSDLVLTSGVHNLQLSHLPCREGLSMAEHSPENELVHFIQSRNGQKDRVECDSTTSIENPTLPQAQRFGHNSCKVEYPAIFQVDSSFCQQSNGPLSATIYQGSVCHYDAITPDRFYYTTN